MRLELGSPVSLSVQITTTPQHTLLSCYAPVSMHFLSFLSMQRFYSNQEEPVFRLARHLFLHAEIHTHRHTEIFLPPVYLVTGKYQPIRSGRPSGMARATAKLIAFEKAFVKGLQSFISLFTSVCFVFHAHPTYLMRPVAPREVGASLTQERFRLRWEEEGMGGGQREVWGSF